MKSKKAALLFCFLLYLFTCLPKGLAHASQAHTVRGMVITTYGTAVPTFSVVVRHAGDKPELVQRKHFKNGEFTIDGLTGDKYQLVISSPTYISTRVEFDFKAKTKPLEHTIVILHTYRNERRLIPGAAYSVSLHALQEKVPPAAHDAYEKKLVDRCYAALLPKWQRQLAGAEIALRSQCWSMIVALVVQMPPADGTLAARMGHN